MDPEKVLDSANMVNLMKILDWTNVCSGCQICHIDKSVLVSVQG